MLLKDKVAVITGAASGIGRATAELFARQGAKVVVADVNQVGGEETAERIRRASGDALFVATDVGNSEQVQGLVEAAAKRYGRLDVIHSNAAAYVRGDAVKTSEEGWDRTLAVCLKATYLLAHFGVPKMLANGGGVIVITSSVHAILGYAGHIAYDASKGGLLAMTRTMAADHAPKIRVNCILPGAIVTGLWAGIPDDLRKRIAEDCPLKRNAQPEEVAQAALFLASDMSSFITGTSLIVDGGLSAIYRGLH